MKTTKQIDQWFNAECKDALSKIPQGIKDLAIKKREYTIIIAENIARQKAFKVKAVLKYLDTLI